MSKLESAMQQHMNYLVLSENRPFSYLDFMLFEVDGIEYKMTHGTYRNKISLLKKAGQVDLAYNSCISFYTLRGHRFSKPITPNHVGVNSSKKDSFVKMIQDLPMDRDAVHDIRLRFEVKGIWGFLSTYRPDLLINGVSKDIQIPTWSIGGRLIRVTVHRTDTVSVMVACSLAPVAADVGGVISLSNTLTRIEERLAVLLTEGGTSPGSDGAIVTRGGNYSRSHLMIPDHSRWTVTMWHFGTDSLVEYTGDKFSMTWEAGQHVLIRVYTKTMRNNKTRIRLERQEIPNKTLPEAIEEKLNAGGYRSP